MVGRSLKVNQEEEEDDGTNRAKGEEFNMMEAKAAASGSKGSRARKSSKTSTRVGG